MDEDSPEGWYYLGTDGTENGPLNFRIIRAHLRLGTLPNDIPVWREGLRDWTEAKNISLFRNMGSGNVPPSPLVEETVKSVENGIYDAKTNYVTDGGTPLFPSTPERRFLLHQDRHDGKKFPSTSKSYQQDGGRPKIPGTGGKRSAWRNLRGGEWFYCSRDKEPRGSIPTVQIVELAKKGIITTESWVWSEDEQPYWIKFSECPRFKDLGLTLKGAAAKPSEGDRAGSAGPRSILRSARGKQRSGGGQHSVTYSADPPLEKKTRSFRHKKSRKVQHAKRGGDRGAGEASAPRYEGGGAAQGAGNGSGGLFGFDIASFEREHELDRANSELEKALAKSDTKDSKLKEYKSKIKLLKEELKIRDEQISSIQQKENKAPGPSSDMGEDSLLRAQLEMAELKLREQDHLLSQKNEEIKKLEITVAETDSELTKARIALSKELSWLLEENAQ